MIKAGHRYSVFPPQVALLWCSCPCPQYVSLVHLCVLWRPNTVQHDDGWASGGSDAGVRGKSKQIFGVQRFRMGRMHEIIGKPNYVVEGAQSDCPHWPQTAAARRDI